jgi:signal transduction histidine kinase
MNRLIQDLLDIAVIEAGQLTIKRARLSASELIVEAVDLQRPLASSSSLELRVDVDPDVPEVGAIGTGSFRCSRTSSTTRSGHKLAVGSR